MLLGDAECAGLEELLRFLGDQVTHASRRDRTFPARQFRRADAALEDFLNRRLDCLGKVFLPAGVARSEEHTSELQSQSNLVCRLLLEKKKKKKNAKLARHGP